MRTAVVLLALSVLAALAAPAVAQTAPDERGEWPDRRVLNIAHRGGAVDYPENTLYAFHQALAAGSHMLEMDLYATADGELIVLHDETLDRTTDGEGEPGDFTVAELQELDAAYWHVPGRQTPHDADAHEYVHRGVATGDRPAPDGFTAADFRIPTLREVLATFPDTLMIVELKAQEPQTVDNARLLAELLDEVDRSEGIIVGSFVDHATEAFKAQAPHVATGYPIAQAGSYWTGAQGPIPAVLAPIEEALNEGAEEFPVEVVDNLHRHVALQVPPELGPLEVVTPELVERAHRNGQVVQVWTINDRAEMERLLDLNVDAIMTDRPGLLTQVLAERERVAGSDRIATALAVTGISHPDEAETVVLARADDYADALTGAPLAVQLDAPLLLTGPDGLDERVVAAIQRLGAATAVLLGGEGALSAAVARGLSDAGVETVERVAGADRFATAVAIAAQLEDPDGRAFLVEGISVDPARGWPDALAAAPYAAHTGRPILLTAADLLPAVTEEALVSLEIAETIVVGGAAAVSETVVEQLADHGPRRVAGPDRYATAALLREESVEAGLRADLVWLASGRNWPDALAAGPAAAAAGHSLLLVDSDDLEASAATAAALADGDLLMARIVGGAAAISPAVEAAVRERTGTLIAWRG
jgi:glycerophosphoryl diester phosphodiesterase